jgi:hypothetical protein
MASDNLNDTEQPTADGLTVTYDSDGTQVVNVRLVEGPVITPDDEALLNSERDFTGETVTQQSQRMFQENAPAAVKSIIMLAKHGTNERIRLQAAQYVVERVLGRVQDNPPKAEDDPYQILLAECVRYIKDEDTDSSTELDTTEDSE